MNGFNATMNGSEKRFRVALFGPQVTTWTADSLSSLQLALNKDDNLEFLKHTLASISSIWPLLEKEFGQHAFPGDKKLEVLEAFSTGTGALDPQTLTNTELAPLTIVSQVVEFFQHTNSPANRHGLDEFDVAQGFCIGFLSAAALASATDRAGFETNVSNAVRLAACAGVVVDAQESSLETRNRTIALCVRLKKAADRELVEMCLDRFPRAYISCITDETTLTITLPESSHAEFCARMSEAKLATSKVGLHGSYHHSTHAQATETLGGICAENPGLLGLPDATKLRLPLRSTADAHLITKGALHEIALQLILCKCAHWFQTIKSTMSDVPHDRIEFVPLGKDCIVPRSLRRGATVGTGDHDDAAAADEPLEEIAIVGMACRFPRAESLAEFWELLHKGETAFGTLPTERFHASHLTREPRLASFWGNFLEKIDIFDHRFFSISGREAKSMDPQQRLALHVAYEALESSGYCSQAAPETDVGCYLGVGAVDYEDNVASENANAFAALGTLRAFISGRISHFFGWTGPSITFDTACSSSLVAIHTACKAVLGGECSMALAGGVNIITSPTLHQNLAAASFLNPNGSSKAFDAAAGGYCRGEGAGILVLKKLSRALADGDTVLGVVAGSAVNQGSNCSSITVPDSGSQCSLHRRVLSSARIEPKEVGYVEAHGTGTPLGDPVEYESVRLALTGSGRDGDLFLGSVKDNIGHTEAASGVAGVIKVLLMMQHRAVPKQANFVSLSPRIKACPEIVVPKTTRPWTAHGRYVALVNNYGAAGSNAALLLRSHVKASSSLTETQTRPSSSAATYPILLSAKSASHLQAYMDVLRSYLPSAEASFGSVAYKISRSHNLSFEHRVAFTAADAQSVVSILNSSTKTMLATAKRTTKLPTVLCFGGQTGQTVRVSRGLYDSCDLFRSHLDKCDAVCQTLGLPSIFPHIFLGDAVEDLVSLHCMLLSQQVSSAKCWIDCGLEVDTLIGHSFGQLAALCVADSISLEDAFQLVSGRARLIRDSWDVEHGAMLSVECDRGEIEAVVDTVNKSGFRVDVACYNGPRSFVLAGDAPSIERAKEECRSFKTTGLQNTHAYHSHLADSVLPGLATVAGSITIRPPRLRVETCSAKESWSRFTAEEVVQHTRRPVYFGDAVERIAARLPSAIWLEAGSATPVISMVRRITNLSERSDVFIPMELGSADATSNLATAACHLWKAGSAVRYWLFHPPPGLHCRYQTVNLPPYQFDKSSHWIPLKIPDMSKQSKEAGLLTRVNNSASGELLFSVDTANAVFELAGRGHAVAGQSLCPASMYIELAALAARSILNSAPTPASEFVPHVEGLVMSAPLGLGGSTSVFLRLRQTSPDSWDFTLFSRLTKPGAVEDGGTEHGRGRISWGSADDAVAQKRLKLLQRFGAQGIRHLSSLAATGISGAMVYKLFSDVVAYADYFRGVQSVSASKNEAVGLVTVPPQYAKLDSGICEPIILDNFLQVAGIHVNCLSQREDDEVFLCTAVEEVIFTSPFMTDSSDSRAWSVYTRYETSSTVAMANDIFVCDASSGNLVLAVLGATFRSVPFKSLARSLTRLNKVTTTVTMSMSPPGPIPDGEDVHDDSAYQTGSSSSPGGEGDIYFKKHDEEHLGLAPPPSQPLAGPQDKKSGEFSNVLEQIRNLFSAVLEIPVEEVRPTSSLNELGVDSLLVSEIQSEVQDRFNINISQADLLSCADIASVAQFIEPEQAVESTENPSQPSLNGVLSPTGDKLTNISSHSASGETGNHVRPNLAVESRERFVAAKSSYDNYARTTGFAGFYSEVFPLQSELVVRYVVEAFAAMGCNLQAMQPGDEIPIIPFDPRHTKLIPQLYKLLGDGGLVTKGADAVFRRTKVPVPTIPTSTLHQEMLAKFPKHASETKLLHSTGHRLSDCVSGAADPIALIFQSSAARALLEDVYTNAPMFKTGTLLLGQFLSSVLEGMGGSRELRILELGAGTGGTSKHIIETLAALGGSHSFSYTFTDLSSSLVTAAKRKFAKWPCMQYMVLDIEKEPAPQLQGSYDIILSTNCIHATSNLVQSLSNMRSMLRPDGIVCLVELTRNLYWFDLVFGLLEGWWLFNDGREHALADEQRWDRSFRAAGFEWVDWSCSSSPESDILRVITASAYRLPSTIDSDLDGQSEDHDLATKQTVTFKEVDGLQLKMDIYFPPTAVDPGKRLPLALMIHGGGHIMLSKNDIRPDQTSLLLRNGFLPISVDYRLCPETTLLEGPMTDVVDALVWVRTVLPTIALARRDIIPDPDRLAAIGWSTGGHLAMTLAWTASRRQVEPPSAILAFYCPTDYEDPFWTTPNIPVGAVPGSYQLNDDMWEEGIFDAPAVAYNVPPRNGPAAGGWLAAGDARSRLAVHMNVYGRTLHVLLGGLDKRTRGLPNDPSPADIAEVSPLAHIRGGAYKTPTFLVHPRQDDLIPWQQAERTFRALQDEGVEAELRIVENVPHLFDLNPRHRGYEAAMEALAEGYEFLCRRCGISREAN